MIMTPLRILSAVMIPANRTPCGARTPAHAARNMEAEPHFPLKADAAVLRLTAEGYGHEIARMDVWNAYKSTMKAADQAGRREETLERVPQPARRRTSGCALLLQVLGCELGMPVADRRRAGTGRSRWKAKGDQNCFFDGQQFRRAQGSNPCSEAGFIERSHLIAQCARGPALDFDHGFPWKEGCDIAGDRENYNAGPALVAGIIGHDNSRSRLSNLRPSRRIQLYPKDVSPSWPGFHSGHPSVSVTAQSSESAFRQASPRAAL